MRAGLSAGLLVCLAGLYGCAQHDMFRPGYVSSGQAIGQLLSKVTPTFPAIAKEEHVSGAVALDVLIDEQGSVIDIRPISGPAILRPAVISAVRQWKFRPFEQNGVPVVVRTTITLNIDFGD